MNNEGHLYPGFAHAGALPSVGTQRWIQGRLLAELPVRKMLVVGSGYGEELDAFLGSTPWSHDWPTVTAIDLADVASRLKAQPWVSRLGSRLAFHQLDLLEAAVLEGFGTFDVVQCSFVLHDICPALRDQAVDLLAKAVRPGGYVLISDIFVRTEGDPIEVIDIYDGFIGEASQALEDGLLERDQFDALVGDGVRMGLTRTQREAARGQRDFFEEPHSLVLRAQRTGLRLVEIVRNRQNAHLLVLLLTRQAGTEDRVGLTIGGANVL